MDDTGGSSGFGSEDIMRSGEMLCTAPLRWVLALYSVAVFIDQSENRDNISLVLASRRLPILNAERLDS